MRTVSILIQLIIILLIASCGAGINNTSEELSGDTFFHESGRDMSYVKSHNQQHKTIYSKIIDYSYNKDFIVVCQAPIRKYHLSLLASELNDGTEHIDFFLKKADSTLTNDPFYAKVLSSNKNYWLIINESHELIGPLTHDEYLNKRIQFRIPENLKLKSEF